MDTNSMLQVYNTANFDVGVTLASTQQRVIRHGSFLPMSIDDILYIESNCHARPFSSKRFVIKDRNNKEYTLEDLGGYTDPSVTQHFDADEIAANLSKNAKHIAAWLKEIDDPVELDAIGEIAKQMDLPGSKLKLVQAKVPNKDLLEPDEE